MRCSRRRFLGSAAALEPVASFALAPGQRADFIVDAVADEGEEALLFSREREGAFVLATLADSGSGRATRRYAPAPLASNPVPPLGVLSRSRHATLRMAGGAMGGLREAVLDGKTVGIRNLAARGKVWAFNGLAEMPEEPLFRARHGETVLLNMVNDTAWPHGMPVRCNRTLTERQFYEYLRKNNSDIIRFLAQPRVRRESTGRHSRLRVHNSTRVTR